MPLNIQLSRGDDCDPNFKFNPTTLCVCPKLGPGSPTLYIRGLLYLFSKMRWETSVCCVDRIDVNHCFNISEININSRSENFCNSYQHFHDRWSQLTRKLSHEGFLLVNLKSLHKLCDRCLWPRTRSVRGSPVLFCS